jgi:hypothetical protein
MLALQLLSFVTCAAAAFRGRQFSGHSAGATPTAFDGEYQTTPTPGPGNDAFEWWWYQVYGAPNPDTGIIPTIEFIFYLGKHLHRL